MNRTRASRYNGTHIVEEKTSNAIDNPNNKKRKNPFLWKRRTKMFFFDEKKKNVLNSIELLASGWPTTAVAGGGSGGYYQVTTPDNSDVGRDMPADENSSSRSDLIFRKHTHIHNSDH